MRAKDLLIQSRRSWVLLTPKLLVDAPNSPRPIALVSGHSLTWLLWSLKIIHSFIHSCERHLEGHHSGGTDRSNLSYRYNPSMMGAYPIGPFAANPYAPYPNPLMAAQMSQMGQMGGFGYGNFGPYSAAGKCCCAAARTNCVVALSKAKMVGKLMSAVCYWL